MMRRTILDCMTLVGATPSRFDGEKAYISTGAVDCDHIAANFTMLAEHDFTSEGYFTSKMNQQRPRQPEWLSWAVLHT